jgi:hypothetical protein
VAAGDLSGDALHHVDVHQRRIASLGSGAQPICSATRF